MGKVELLTSILSFGRYLISKSGISGKERLILHRKLQLFVQGQVKQSRDLFFQLGDHILLLVLNIARNGTSGIPVFFIYMKPTLNTA